MAEAIVLTDDGSKSYVARCIPGAYWDKKSRSWLLKNPNPRSAMVALYVFPELANAHPELVAKRDELLTDVRPVDHARDLGYRIADHAPVVANALHAEGLDWYDFQDVDLGYQRACLQEHGGAYLGWEMGLGKTLGACSLIDGLDAQRSLIVSPNTAKWVTWEPALERWLPGYIHMVLPNEKRKRERTLDWWRCDIQGGEGNARTLSVHPEALDLVDWKKYGDWDLVVVDEAHRFKNPKAKMTRALKRIPRHMSLAMSGTIIANHVEELFSVLQFLFPSVYRSKWRDWNDRYLDYVDGPYGRICLGLKPGLEQQMREELGVFMVYRRKEDELDLPPKTENTLMVDISPGQRRVYSDLESTCVAAIDEATVVKAEEGLVMLTKLRQVATGLDLFGDVADSAKLDVATDLILDSPDDAFVVFSWYRAAAHALAERLALAGEESYVVDGDVPDETRADCVHEFQAGTGPRIFIGTISTMKESVDLYRANNVIFLDRSWNPGDNKQAEERVYRIGQDKPVTITHLVARDTVDQLRVQPALGNKVALRAQILGGKGGDS